VVVGARPDLLPKDMNAFLAADCAAATENLQIQAAARLRRGVCGVYPDARRVDEIKKTSWAARASPSATSAVGVPDESPRHAVL
jgi:hypothetical protein